MPRHGTVADRDGLAQFLRELRRLKRDDENPASPSHLRLVVQCARQVERLGEKAQLTLLDLVQEGYIGLVAAREKFDPTRQIKFSTYARWWIRAKMFKAIYNSPGYRAVRLSANAQDQLHDLEKISKSMTNVLGRPPTDQEVLTEGVRVLELKRSRMQELLALRNATAERLDEVHEDGDRGSSKPTTGQRLADTGPTPEQWAVTNEAARRLLGALNELSDRERSIITEHYGLENGEPKTLAEIGRENSITRERVRQIVDRAQKKLRQHLQSN